MDFREIDASGESEIFFSRSTTRVSDILRVLTVQAVVLTDASNAFIVYWVCLYMNSRFLIDTRFVDLLL